MGKKIMFFVIPEMPSKTFVMLYKKKLPDHFKEQRAGALSLPLRKTKIIYNKKREIIQQ